MVKSGSILPAMLFHFVNNALGVLHGNLPALREQSPLLQRLTLPSAYGIHYPLWLVGIALVLGTGLIWILLADKGLSRTVASTTNEPSP